MEFGGLDDEDVFYSELRRQILLLAADDNEESLRSTCRLGSNRLTGSFPLKLQPESYFNWWERQNTESVPTWLVNLWRNSNGTGVFIPVTVKATKYSRGKITNGRSQLYKQLGQN